MFVSLVVVGNCGDCQPPGFVGPAYGSPISERHRISAALPIGPVPLAPALIWLS